MNEIIFSPSDFIALLNQTIEVSFPVVVIEGELSSFRISKNQWVYFDLKDETASVQFFGSVYQLPGPLEDGITVRVVGTPRFHPRFGFSVSFQSIVPVGEGAIKKASDLLAKKLEAEGLFANERKRPLPVMPTSVGLITAGTSAAYADFIKIINSRWAGLDIQLIDVLVQGDNAPAELVDAIGQFNKMATPPEVLVMTRGGGSLEDLASFNDERVVRAVAASRIPMLVAVGHEVDVSLAELAADMRASTPSNAAQIVVPDKFTELANIDYERRHLGSSLKALLQDEVSQIRQSQDIFKNTLNLLLSEEKSKLNNAINISKLLDPKAALRRGYAIVRAKGKYVKSIEGLSKGQQLDIELSDGKIKSIIESLGDVKNA